MAARFSSGTGELAAVVRRRQDTVNRLLFLDQPLLKILSTSAADRDPAAEAPVHKEIDSAEIELATTDGTLARRFPEFQILSDRATVRLVEAQQLLGPQEALLSYLITPDESYLWVVRRTRCKVFRLDIGSKALDQRVTTLRRSLDTSQTHGKPVGFPALLAHELYRLIFSPAEAELVGINHLIVVPDGALQSLPLAVLIAKPPLLAAADRDMEWLAKRYAFSSLPSESSLMALRRIAVYRQAPEPFVGFGDPAFNGSVPVAGQSAKSPVTMRALADVKQVSLLPPLPDSASEISAMASTLGATKQSIFLGDSRDGDSG